MGFKSNVKSVTIKSFNAIDKNGKIEKINEKTNGISVIYFNKEKNISESLIYNSDKSSIKELKKYRYDNQGRLKSVEETNDFEYTDNYKLSKFTYPQNNKKIEKWYNSNGDNTYVWNTTLDDNSNVIVSNSYENGILNWSRKYEYDDENRLIKSISFQKDSSNFNRNVIKYDGLKKVIKLYKKNNKLFFKKVEQTNEYGDVISNTHYNSLNKVTTEPTTYYYKYDTHNNWIIKKTTRYVSKFDEGNDLFIKKPISTIIERNIEYYD